MLLINKALFNKTFYADKVLAELPTFKNDSKYQAIDQPAIKAVLLKSDLLRSYLK